jgi:hypothetical protein
MHKRKGDDWKLFTRTVLLISATSAIARDEIDELIATGTNHDHDLAQLKHARSGVALLAAIADYYKEETADEPED